MVRLKKSKVGELWDLDLMVVLPDWGNNALSFCDVAVLMIKRKPVTVMRGSK